VALAKLSPLLSIPEIPAEGTAIEDLKNPDGC